MKLALLSLSFVLASPMAMASPQDAAAGSGSGSSSIAPMRLDPVELQIWNDPMFQKQFVQSYSAETEIEPKVDEKELKQMQKVLELMAADQIEKVIPIVEKQRAEGGSAVFDFTLANIHFQREQLDQAVAAYEAAIVKHPKFRRAWRNLGVIRMRQSNFEKAVPALTKVIELGGGDAVTYGLLGFAYSSLGNDLSAESAYRMAILLDAETIDWKMGLARSFFKQRRFDDAVAISEMMLERQPDRADLWMLQANAYIGLGQPLRAAINLELVDRLGQSTADGLNMLGDIYINEGLFDLAVANYIRAMEKDAGKGPERAIRAAKVLAARSALVETRKMIEGIETAFPTQITEADRKDLLRLRARIAVAEGAGGEEATILEELVSLDPLDGEALILLGQHSGRGGDIEKAVFYYERAAALERFEADAKVRHAQLLVSKGRYDEALPLLRRAQTVRPRENVQEYLQQVERVAKNK